MNDAASIIRAIDEHLEEDDRQLRRVVQQTKEIHGAFDDLLVRLRRELQASSASNAGALHLRG